MTPANFSDGGVVDTRRMFHAASPASHMPALRPTRGSGFGATADMPGPPGVVDVEQAARASRPSATGPAGGQRLADNHGCFLCGRRRRLDGSATPGASLAAGRREGGQHLLHAVDLGGLVGVDVGGEPERALLLRRRPARRTASFTIVIAPLVVLDHEGQEQPVELRAPRAASSCASCSSASACRASASRDPCPVMSWPACVRRALRHRLVPVGEPALHEVDLVALARRRCARQRCGSTALAPWAGAQPAISTACAWWAIMPVMNAASAGTYGGTGLSDFASAAAAGEKRGGERHEQEMSRDAVRNTAAPGLGHATRRVPRGCGERIPTR